MGANRDGSRNLLVALIAAHNEERSIGVALGSLADQSRSPDRIIVVADRCTDRTAAIAIESNVEVFETADNRHRKAGALNQALAAVLPSLDPDDLVLLMDADTELSPLFLAAAERRLRTSDEGRPAVGAVGAVFLAEQPVARSIEVLQRNEYLRYAHDVQRRNGRSEVISGTAGVFPVAVLRQIAAERGRRLPAAGYVYDDSALTEDNELTLAVKHLGFRCASPSECTVRTELIPTLRTLYFQRIRWQRGALENLRSYGVTKTTIPYIVRQLLIHVGIIFFPFFLTVLLVACMAGGFPWSWPWFLVSLIVIVERVWTVRRGGPRAVTLAALVLPELWYDLFIHAVFVRALVDATIDARAHWDHDEARQVRVAGVIAHILRTVVQIVIPVVVVGIAIALALLACLAGVQWIVVGAIVGTGIAHSALRTTRLDPLRLAFGSCENPPETRHAELPSPRTATAAATHDFDESIVVPVSELPPPLILFKIRRPTLGPDLGLTPPRTYELSHLVRRNATGRVLPNGVCLRLPVEGCDKGHACLSCGRFATNFIHLDVLRQQLAIRVANNTTGRDQYRQRSGPEVYEDNIRIIQRRREIGTLRAVIGHIQTATAADTGYSPVGGAGGSPT